LKLRTFEGERVKGELFPEHPASRDGLPVLVVDGDAYLPEEADFFIEAATSEQLEELDNAGYDLPLWEDREIEDPEEEEGEEGEEEEEE
jgi:hypothetical protein